MFEQPLGKERKRKKEGKSDKKERGKEKKRKLDDVDDDDGDRKEEVKSCSKERRMKVRNLKIKFSLKQGEN